MFPVTLYLTNGFQLRGMVKGLDNFTVVLDSEGKQRLYINMQFPQYHP